jgi:membrane-associated phospholipid phosphatase
MQITKGISGFFILFSLLLSIESSFGQIKPRKDTLTLKYAAAPRHQLRKGFTAPIILMGAAWIAKTDNDVFSNEETEEERNEHFSQFRTHVDDYLQYVPIVAVYGLNAAGVKGKNNFGNRTAIIVKAELMMAVLTYSLKKITAVPRPDTGEPTSFPSGHTAQAFAAATFMAKEYGHKSVWYSIGAYSVATSVGVLRVMNNRHWVSDVLAGAAIGILSTNIAYLTHRYKWGDKMNKVIVMPSYSNKSGGIYFSYTFR